MSCIDWQCQNSSTCINDTFHCFHQLNHINSIECRSIFPSEGKNLTRGPHRFKPSRMGTSDQYCWSWLQRVTLYWSTLLTTPWNSIFDSCALHSASLFIDARLCQGREEPARNDQMELFAVLEQFVIENRGSLDCLQKGCSRLCDCVCSRRYHKGKMQDGWSQFRMAWSKSWHSYSQA